jgi:hypothetical protein
MDRRVAFTTGLAALVVVVAAWTARTRVPSFEPRDGYEVITCELSAPHQAEGWVDLGFFERRARAVAAGRTLYLQVPERFYVGSTGVLMLDGGALSAPVDVKPWWGWLGHYQYCASPITPKPSRRFDVVVDNDLPGGTSYVHSCELSFEVADGHATLWIPRDSDAYFCDDAWAVRWDGAWSDMVELPAADGAPLQLTLPPQLVGRIGVTTFDEEIVEVWRNGPANAAGLQARDRILTIDGRALETGPYGADADDLLAGPPGSFVRVGLERLGRRFEVTLEREVLHDPFATFHR